MTSPPRLVGNCELRTITDGLASSRIVPIVPVQVTLSINSAGANHLNSGQINVNNGALSIANIASLTNTGTGTLTNLKVVDEYDASLDAEMATGGYELEGNNRVWTIDTLEPSLVMRDKVHFELTFTRWHPDGTRYWTVPALWLVTRQDDRWGIQVRSLMPPTFETGSAGIVSR